MSLLELLTFSGYCFTISFFWTLLELEWLSQGGSVLRVIFVLSIFASNDVKQIFRLLFELSRYLLASGIKDRLSDAICCWHTIEEPLSNAWFDGVVLAAFFLHLASHFQYHPSDAWNISNGVLSKYICYILYVMQSMKPKNCQLLFHLDYVKNDRLVANSFWTMNHKIKRYSMFPFNFLINIINISKLGNKRDSVESQRKLVGNKCVKF